MSDYFTPGMRLYLDNLVDWEAFFSLARGEDVDVEAEVGAYRTILETAASLVKTFEKPAREHWEAEAKLTGDGGAVPPPHICEAYAKLRENGLVCLPISENYGGYGLPQIVNCMVLEMISRADTSLMTVIGLQSGTAADIEKYGSEDMKKKWLPLFTSGEVQGCMDLTESQAGSDLGQITARAADLPGGDVQVDGQKIFITNGGAEVHLVLARDHDTFDSSKSTTNGLSLLLVPRHNPDGSANGVRVSRLESKIGIHGSPTCEVVFEKARGVRLGQKGQGFRAMLDLMNNARLGVAAQALGLSEAAYYDALAYAKQREQFGKPIIEQPLVKAMLAKMEIHIEAVRALLYPAFELAGMNKAREDVLASKQRSEAELSTLQKMLERDTTRLRLLTPLCKYYATEICSDITRDAMQVFGGLGFTMDADVAKLHADSLIMTVYEGTSEIQVSFALREMGKGALAVVFEDVRRQLAAVPADDKRAALVKRLTECIALVEASAQILFSDIGYALLRAKLLAEMVIDILAGAELLRQAGIDPARLDLAEAFIRRHALDLELNARRIQENYAGRLERDGRVLELS